MKSQVELCRESSGASCSEAHIAGCIAAIIVMAVFVPAKLFGYLPASMTTLRIMSLPVLAYGLVAAGMLWKLGRAIKRAKTVDDLTPTSIAIPQIV